MKCAFTGPRPRSLPFPCIGKDPAYEDLKRRLTNATIKLYDEGVREFLCGMALGADTLFCEIVITLKHEHPDIKLSAVIPFRGQADVWNENDRSFYHRLLEECDDAVCLQENYSDDCYIKRNEYMVNKSDILLAVCDPGDVPLRSGTGATVRYAKSQGKRIVFIPPVDRKTP